MRKITLLFVATLVSFNILSQTNFEPGYIIDLSGNKTDGFINYKNWDINPEKIEFKASENGNVNEYTPLEIKEFFVSNDLYVGTSVEIDLSSTKTEELTYNANPELVNQNVFLQILYKGDKELLYLRDENRKEHFFIKNDKGEYVYLLYRKYLKDVNISQQTQEVVSKNEKYKGTLIIYMNDCSEIRSKINSLKYSKEGFFKLFKAYSKCSENKFEYVKEMESVIVEFGVKAGATMTNLYFNTALTSAGSYHPMTVLDDKTSYDYAFGISADFLIPRNFYRFSVYSELLYSQYYAEGNRRRDMFTREYIEFGPKFLGLNLMLKYKYPIGKSFLFGNIGLLGDYLISSKEEYRIESDNFETIYSDFPKVQKFTYGVILGGGLKYKNFSGEVRYSFDIGPGIIENYYVSSDINRLSLLIGYTF
ncbi:MAG: hypothetical protein A2W99_02015 [Bacteroidetes bacterium GWF2_33_16]|nr:MAG: hypothetical protein A2X00_16140 [Bacteroidetes bacterium GWE2_32_14]OFY07045.1 MAG: hypothetical protein A2W99_02015 [Bacteroidetes bacterium GWF2_33_16]